MVRSCEIWNITSATINTTLIEYINYNVYAPPTHSSPESEYKTREYKRNLKNWNSARISNIWKIASVTIKSNFKLSMRHKLQDILVKTITDYLYMHIEIYIYVHVITFDNVMATTGRRRYFCASHPRITHGRLHHTSNATNTYTYTCYSLYDMYLWDLKCYISNYKCHFNMIHKLQYIPPHPLIFRKRI